MDDAELEKSKKFTILKIVDYIPNSVISKTILRKITGNVTATSFAAGETLKQKISPFDTLIQIIDGSAEIMLDNQSGPIETGESIIIPAHSGYVLTARVGFKMVSTTIKSGYEE